MGSDPQCPMMYGAPVRSGGSRAVFLDRDGVLIPDTGYPDDPHAISLLAGVGEALRVLRAAGWRLVVASNQSGVARGKFTLERLEQIHDRLRDLLAAEGVTLDALYYCPHHPEGRPPFDVACDHRKPAPGMLRSAAKRMGLDLAACWMVGDKESDVEAAHAVGCRAVRLGAASRRAEVTADDLPAAARLILAA
jgi:D-glycero-D-manno-heptose 1,7-bisphosphate phosphatase